MQKEKTAASAPAGGAEPLAIVVGDEVLPKGVEAKPAESPPSPPKDVDYWAGVKRPDIGFLAAAKALHRDHWVIGRELTEAEFEKGLRDAAGWPSK